MFEFTAAFACNFVGHDVSTSQIEAVGGAPNYLALVTKAATVH